MDALKKRENESQFEYKIRLCNAKLAKELDLDWCELVELLELNCSSDHLRKLAYAYKEYSEYLNEKQIEEVTDNDMLQEIEFKKMELQKEKIKMQDQRRELNKLIRTDARFEHLCQILEDSVANLSTIKPFLYIPQEISVVDMMDATEAVLMLSDLHIGSKFKNALGEYNIDIAKSRLNELLHKTLMHCQMNNVQTLHLELLGDNLNGGIHWSSKIESEEDTISQLMTYEELISEFIYALSLRIQCVKVYSVIGNHSRLNMNIKENQKGENLERLVPHYLKARLKDLKNVEIIDDANIDDGLIMFDVMGTRIMGMHGDLDKPNAVIDNMIKMFKVIPDEFHLGHYHHDFEKTEYDIELVVNGSLQGTDNFAYRIRKSGRPMQKLCIYDSDGKLCTYKIKLN